jgi:thiamine pyrophosphate-dependent acetolactate synthase large subunit-like protein
LVIASSIGRAVEETMTLARIAERVGLPVVAHTPRYLCLPTDHPLHHGFDPHPFLADADLILVVEADVPWMPSVDLPAVTARIAHIGADPAFVRYPMRSFPSHLSIAAHAGSALNALDQALEIRPGSSLTQLKKRRAWAIERAAAQRAKAVARTAADTSQMFLQEQMLLSELGIEFLALGNVLMGNQAPAIGHHSSRDADDPVRRPAHECARRHRLNWPAAARRARRSRIV